MGAIKVAIVGATGETGSSIVNGLIESPTDFITALTRPPSLRKQANLALQERGVRVVAFDVNGPLEELVKLLEGIDVVIAAMGPSGFADQIPLATASKLAGVKRFVPCAYAPVSPPKGVVDVRDQKEDILNHIKKLRLPYTVIDIGWWYQGFILKLPSGRTDYARFPDPIGDNYIPGDGNMPTALTDVSDVGRYVARIIADPRTLNRMVFAYGEVITANQVYDLVEKVSGEKIQRNYVAEAQLTALIAATREATAKGATDFPTIVKLLFCQYHYSWGIRADNTPEYAEYLGYLSGKELYPDFKPIRFESFLKDLLEGKARRVYS